MNTTTKLTTLVREKHKKKNKKKKDKNNKQQQKQGNTRHNYEFLENTDSHNHAYHINVCMYENKQTNK